MNRSIIFPTFPLTFEVLLFNPFPTPGIRLGAVHGRRGASGDAQDAPVGLSKRSPAPQTRLSVPYHPY